MTIQPSPATSHPLATPRHDWTLGEVEALFARLHEAVLTGDG